jgi:mannose-6-phosphate isomerase-like protein (cupin superfamily)
MNATADREPGALQLFYRHEEAPLTALDDGPLAGLRHRTVIDSRSGARGLALWQEEHLPGFKVPLHLHDCEEVITVIDGCILASVEGRSFPVGRGESFLIPAWVPHGFEVTGTQAVRLLAIFASSEPRIFRQDGTPSVPPWEGGASHHLEDPAPAPPGASARSH